MISAGSRYLLHIFLNSVVIFSNFRTFCKGQMLHSDRSFEAREVVVVVEGGGGVVVVAVVAAVAGSAFLAPAVSELSLSAAITERERCFLCKQCASYKEAPSITYMYCGVQWPISMLLALGRKVLFLLFPASHSSSSLPSSSSSTFTASTFA